jgi:hypothetical protein
LEETARKIGRHSKTLKSHYPDLCEQIVSRFRNYCSQEQKKLADTLSSNLKHFMTNSEPPKSLRQIANITNISVKQYHKYAPDLAVQTVQRYRQYRNESAHQLKLQERSNRRQGDIDLEQVESILITALRISPPPSLSKITRESGYSGDTLYKFPDICRFIVERRKDINSKPNDLNERDKLDNQTVSKEDMRKVLTESLEK